MINSIGFAVGAGVLVAWGGARWIRSCLGALGRSGHLRPVEHRTVGWVAALGALWLGPFVGWLLAGRPVFGLLLPALLPLWLPWTLHLVRARRERAFEESALTFFHALTGLLRAGVALPQALFRLAERSRGDAFTTALREALGLYPRGGTLIDCLRRLQEKAPEGGMLHGLTVLEAAYRDGLPLVPFLERWVPRWEREVHHHGRIRRLRHSILAQAAVAATLPWMLYLVLEGLGPGSGGPNGETGPGALSGMAVLGWEALGVGVIWRASRW